MSEQEKKDKEELAEMMQQVGPAGLDATKNFVAGLAAGLAINEARRKEK